MTPAEREESERRRKLIHDQNRAANPLRKGWVVIPPKDRHEDLAALLGQSLAPDTADVDWKSLTSGN